MIVLCENCKFYNDLPSSNFRTCLHPNNIQMINHPIYVEKLIIKECQEINKNNNCKNFEQRQKPISEKIVNWLDKIILK